MKIETRYFNASRSNKIGRTEYKKNFIDSSEIPGILSEPAVGKFPGLEVVLEQRGIVIPKTMPVEQLLAAVCIGATTLIRPSNKFHRPKTMSINLIIDDLHFGQDDSGKTGYSKIGFEADFHDGMSVVGKLRMPGFKQEKQGLWGLPWYCRVIGENKLAFSDKDLFNTNTNEFTPAGLRLVDFVAQTIKQL